ncbi:MAG: VanZ family protein [Alphaproteobacteria bacterium]|nr:VanZ family protein [Alphaproteobacteria bacterium]
MKRAEYLAWAVAAGWSGIIFVTIPFVRAAVSYVEQNWGGDLFSYLVTTCVLLASAAAVVLLLKRRQKSLSGYAWLLGIAGVVIYLTFYLQSGSAVEAVHFLQYGMLSLLLFRAFAHRINDHSIYAAVTISGGTIGMLDETIQWLTPERYFGFNDIWINFTAVALVQVALAAGIRPRRISGWPDGTGLRRLCRLGAVAIAYLGLCHINTPERVAWLSARLPLPDVIVDEIGIMVEYGHLYGDGKNMLFRSRLAAGDLRRSARERPGAGARLPARFGDSEQYIEFLETYTPLNDPFLHEAGVHLYSRGFNLERAREATDGEKQRLRFTRAYWENRILEENFAELLRLSGARWPAGLADEIQGKIDRDEIFESLVSRHLITAFSREQAFWSFLCAAVGLLLLGRYFAKRWPVDGEQGDG